MFPQHGYDDTTFQLRAIRVDVEKDLAGKSYGGIRVYAARLNHIIVHTFFASIFLLIFKRVVAKLFNFSSRDGKYIFHYLGLRIQNARTRCAKKKKKG